MELTNETLHDIRNMIASIKAYVQIIKRRVEKNNMKEEIGYLTAIDEKADHLISLIDKSETKTKL